MNFEEFFKTATEDAPFPFQRKFAEDASFPQLVRIPTGLGKTAMAVVGWLWRRFGGNGERKAATPLRLVYCLPMRVLVEQTAENACAWISKLKAAKVLEGNTPLVHILMGGEKQNEKEWDVHPEREALLVGTQDMLLSRALNRGYAASRARWPLQFGLLHTDCLWVFDEIQLMGAGLATTAQLEAFRRTLPREDSESSRAGHGCRTVWMSATMQRDWIKTVDFATLLASAQELGFDFETEIMADGLHEKSRKILENRWNAEKPLARTQATGGDMENLAKEILGAHKRGTRTIAVVNTVSRACELFKALKTADVGRQKKKGESKSTQRLAKNTDAPPAIRPGIVLLHSRFRPKDREQHLHNALAKIDPDDLGLIVVSTQVIEAGVDVSATTLFTELAPWASLVQRFGRCNRRGEDSDARVFWIGLPDGQADAVKIASPYEMSDLTDSAERLKPLTDAGLRALPQIDLPFEHTHVIRRKDLIDLFDTTPDLAGNDIDIDRFVREIEESDVRVFWRHWDRPKGHEQPPDDQPAPRREELCSAPIGSDKNPGFRRFADKHGGDIWRWNFLDKRWERADAGKIAPGQVYLVHADAGGYSTERGWDPDNEDRVEPIDPKGAPPDGIDDDPLSRIGVWQTISEHTGEVCTELQVIVKALSIKDEAEALHLAVRWHDRGKAHKVFQNAIDDGQEVQRQNKVVTRRQRPIEWRGCTFVAKAPDKTWKDRRLIDPGFWQRYDWLPEQGRRHFRHELASALAVLDPRNDRVPDEFRDLVAYLVAAHHGKVRLSIRSLPNERHPQPRSNGNGNGRRFARGVWEDDELPATDLGGGVNAPAVRLSLEPMELGLCEEQPFAGQPSWAERMIRLRDRLGPFRLAYLEAIVRAADMRASRAAERQEAEKEKRAVAAARRETLGG